MIDTGKIRLVVLNFNGGDHVLRCVKHLHELDWPPDEREIVVVDNASTDGSCEELAKAFPFIKLLRLPTNDGFPANNLAMRDLRGVRYVGLVNNDAFVEPGFLAPLVEELDRDAGLGAASPLILFEPRYVEVVIEAPAALVGRGDPRELGVRISGLRLDGRDVWRDAQVASGGHGPETGRSGTYEWTSSRAVLRVPVPRRGEIPPTAEVRLSAVEEKPTTMSSGSASVEVEVGRTPDWFEVPIIGPGHDVVNNAGSIVFTDGYGADRGLGEIAGARFDEPSDLFAWCGGAVLLRPEYLRKVGLFDERFFLYYEDTDLAWRGRSQGWRYRYVPGSVVRHLHAATSLEGSDRFHFFTERNRLLMLVKNAPAPMVRAAVRTYLKRTYDAARRDVVAALVARRRPNMVPVTRRIKAFMGFVWLLPAMMVARRRVRRRRVVPDAMLLEELTPCSPAE